jgi:hypothetical protein
VKYLKDESEAIKNAFGNLAQVLKIAKLVRGVCEIEDFSIYYYDKANCECSFVSSNPSLEYNLVKKDYLPYDRSFSLTGHAENSFIWWEDNFEEEKKDLLIHEKLINFGYSAGCAIVKQKSATAVIIYAFATKSCRRDIRKYYQENYGELLRIGDFLYMRLSSILHKLDNNRLGWARKGLLKLVEEQDCSGIDIR